jgi:hypothetical protein
MKRIAQILPGTTKVHHVFEAEPDETWVNDINGNKVPNWPPTPDGPMTLIDVTGKGINEGDGYNPETGECLPMPVPTWNDEEYLWDLMMRPESDVTGINS